MTSSAAGAVTGSAGRRCPAWCVSWHEIHAGEEDWVHTSAPITVDEGVLARLCMSVDPATGAIDGPHLLIGSTEYTLTAAARRCEALLALIRIGASTRAS